MNETQMKARIAELEAQLAAVQQGVPEGWKLVPIEPTEDIEQSAADYLGECVKAHGLWLAMLAAAPNPPATNNTQQGLDAQQLHSDILNLPVKQFDGDINQLLGYKMGFKDARHAASELVIAAKAKHGGVR